MRARRRARRRPRPSSSRRGAPASVSASRSSVCCSSALPNAYSSSSTFGRARPRPPRPRTAPGRIRRSSVVAISATSWRAVAVRPEATWSMYSSISRCVRRSSSSCPTTLPASSTAIVADLRPELLEHPVALGADLLLRPGHDRLRLLLGAACRSRAELIGRRAGLLDDPVRLLARRWRAGLVLRLSSCRPRRCACSAFSISPWIFCRRSSSSCFNRGSTHFHMKKKRMANANGPTMSSPAARVEVLLAPTTSSATSSAWARTDARST